MAWTEVQTDPDWRYYVESCSHVMPCPAARLHPFLLSSAVSQAQASCLVQHVRTFSLKFKACRDSSRRCVCLCACAESPPWCRACVRACDILTLTLLQPKGAFERL